MQVVTASFREENVDELCHHVERILDEEWTIGFIKQCEVDFGEGDDVTYRGRFEVKLFDAPESMAHLRDSVYLDCSAKIAQYKLEHPDPEPEVEPEVEQEKQENQEL